MEEACAKRGWSPNEISRYKRAVKVNLTYAFCLWRVRNAFAKDSRFTLR